MGSKIGIIVEREFLERVNKKSFIFTTILMPLLMLGLMAAPALIMMMDTDEVRHVKVVDDTGMIAEHLVSDESTVFDITDADLAKTREAGESSLVLYIPAGVLDNTQSLQLFTNEATSIQLENNITRQINSVIEDIRLREYDIVNLGEILDSVHSDVSLQAIRTDKSDGEKQASSMLSYILGVVLTFLLYMVLMLYGQMVMTSVIEEKNNRVLEIMVSSVRPTQLMLGKIIGICLVAVTQMLIWGVLIAGMSAFVLPALLPEAVASEVSQLNAGTLNAAQANIDIDMLQALAMISDVSYLMGIFGLLILFLIGGFMLYAAVSAAIGSAVDNIQDAGQLQSVVLMPIILGIIFGMSAATSPMSTLSVWMSMIPFTSPMVMMARIPFGIPQWQIWVSLVLLFASFFGMVWVAAKIYRIGIFMYGKKPTLKDMIKWMKYK